MGWLPQHHLWRGCDGEIGKAPLFRPDSEDTTGDPVFNDVFEDWLGRPE